MANKLYQKLIRQYSDDGGLTWKNVEPPVYQIGELLEFPSNCKSEQTKRCRWSEYPSNIYRCNNTTKHYVEYEECTEDGQVWTKSGAEREGRIMQGSSPDCGFPIIRWRTLSIAEGYICIKTEKWTKKIQEKSTDNGKSWTPTGKEEAVALYQKDSIDCGYVPPVSYNVDFEQKGGEFMFKLNNKDYFTNKTHYKATFGDLNIIDLRYCTRAFANSNITQLHVLTIVNTVLKMDSMFESCSYLTLVNSKDWDVSGVSTFHNMFKGCVSLPAIDTKNWISHFCSDFSGMFDHCTKITTLDLSKIDISKGTNFNGMFNFCSQLGRIDMTRWHVSEAMSKTPVEMFKGCNNLKTIILNDSDCKTIDWIKKSLEKSQIKGVKIETNIPCGTMKDYILKFGYFTSEEPQRIKINNIEYSMPPSGVEININTYWGIEMVNDLTDMFTSTGIHTLSHMFSTENVTSLNGMFYNCANVDVLELQTMDTRKVNDVRNLFGFASKLMTIDMSNWVLDNCQLYSGMFRGCSALRTIRLANSTDKTIKIVEDELKAAGIRDRVTVITYK